MEYRRLGKAGVRISTIGLGSWLTFGGTVEEEKARRCIDRAYELGVNFFDTANVYGRGAAERVVGRALARHPRESFVLATKVFFPMGEGPNDHGLSHKHVFEQCHSSLRRLEVEYVDLYQCHRYDEETPLEETCEVMNDLLRQGKILYWGVSEWTGPQLRDAVALCRDRGWTAPVSNQPEYNALQRRIEEDVLPTSRELGLGNVVWSPLAQGILTGKYRSVEDVPPDSRAAGRNAGFMARYLRPDVLEAVRGFVELAQEAGCTPGQLAIAWCLRRAEVSSSIIGATRERHIEENVTAADLAPGEDLIAEVDRLFSPLTIAGV